MKSAYNKQTSLVPMIKAFVLHMMEQENLSQNAFRLKVRLASSNPLRSLLDLDGTSISTVETILNYYNMNYTDLEKWYENITDV